MCYRIETNVSTRTAILFLYYENNENYLKLKKKKNVNTYIEVLSINNHFRITTELTTSYNL